jgi:hypothetical protein
VFELQWDITLNLIMPWLADILLHTHITFLYDGMLAALFASPTAREKAQLCSNKEVVFPFKTNVPNGLSISIYTLITF